MRIALLILAAGAMAACGEGQIGGITARPDANEAVSDAGPMSKPDSGSNPIDEDAGTMEVADAGPPLDPSRDEDGDGLTNGEEAALGRLTSAPAGCVPNPRRRTLILELDSMTNRAIDDDTLEIVAGAFDALPSGGIQLCIYRDEENITPFDLDGDLNAIGAFLGMHGPTFTDRGMPRIPYAKMLHAIVVTRRTDIPGRGGDTILNMEGNVENSGVLIYRDALDELHPACQTPTLPPVVVEEALAGSLVHELGHTLQLGHDTDVGGEVVHWNIMSVQSSCADAQMRTHGDMNDDPSLGNTRAVSAPRFSAAAAALIDIRRKVSADVSQLDRENGFEM